MKKFSANLVFPANSAPITNGVLVTDDEGGILDLLQNDDGLEDVLQLEGFICPGFVNSHCHLELSHLKGELPENKGLVSFIKPIINLRKAGREVVDEAMFNAEQEMISNGIVAVGDICNSNDSFTLKSEGRMKYHNYIEVIGLDPDKADVSFAGGEKLYDESRDAGLSSSIVPHAPYTASARLLNLIADHARLADTPMCIHNQESEHENTLFNDGTGPLREFYADLGNDLAFFKSPGTNSMEAVLNAIGSGTSMLLVHNTYSKVDDIAKAALSNSAVSFCLCPNANRYIEGVLPDLNLFVDGDHMVMLGTDSLSSNWSLSILDEMKTISNEAADIELSTLIQWASLNGARYLGLNDSLGSFEKGKRPGVNLISDVDVANCSLTENSKIRVLA